MSESEKPCSTVGDPRPIISICWGPTYGDEWWYVGMKESGQKSAIVKIVAYEENGQGAPVPWVAVYFGDGIAYRADCAGATIRYE